MAYVFNPFTQELDFVGPNAGLINFRGAFSDSTTQLVQSTTTAQAITLDTVELADGVTLSNNSRIVLPIVGDYLLNFSAMLTTNSNQPQSVDIWLRKNGTGAVSHSNTRQHVAKNTYAVLTVPLFITATAQNDYFELMMCASSAINTGGVADTGLASIAASAANPVRPEAPSIIVTVNKITT